VNDTVFVEKPAFKWRAKFHIILLFLAVGSGMKDDVSGHRMVAKAIITGSLIIVLAPLAYSAVAGLFATWVASNLAAQAQKDLSEMQRQAAIAAYHSKNTMPQAPQSMPLRQNETCVAGTVLRSVPPPAKGWVQVLEGGKPVRCVGRVRS
jgi:hypothetical protein